VSAPLFRLSGACAEVRVGAKIALRLGSWQLTQERQGDAVVVTAEVRYRSEFWLTQRPFELWLDFGTALWGWRDIQMALGRNAVIRALGDPEVKEAADVPV
jgi:hypothetical protein